MKKNTIAKSTKTIKTVKKEAAAFDWKGLVRILNELEVNVSAVRLSEFIEAKGIAVSSRSIASVRAHLNR